MKVYAGTDPLTGREIRLRKTCKTERAAQIQLGKLLKLAAAGRQPETNATVAELMDPAGGVAKVIAEGRKTHPEMALYLWLAAITSARRGELCALQACDLDLDNSVLHLAFNYIVVDGRRVRKDTRTHQDRYLAIDPVTCAMLREHLDAIRAELTAVGLELPENAYVFSNDPMGANPWNPDWATHKAGDLAAAAGVKLNIKGLRHYADPCLRSTGMPLPTSPSRPPDPPPKATSTRGRQSALRTGHTRCERSQI